MLDGHKSVTMVYTFLFCGFCSSIVATEVSREEPDAQPFPTACLGKNDTLFIMPPWRRTIADTVLILSENGRLRLEAPALSLAIAAERNPEENKHQIYFHTNDLSQNITLRPPPEVRS